MVIYCAEVSDTGVLGYRALARGVYNTDTPSKARVSAVTRAARQLEKMGLVEIYAWEDDRRKKIVLPSQWLNIAFGLVQDQDEMRAEYGCPPDTRSFINRLAEKVQSLKGVTIGGLVTITPHGVRAQSPNRRALTLDRPRIDDGDTVPFGFGIDSR